MTKFTETFGKYVCPEDRITVDVGDLTVTARIEYDLDHKIDDDDCHNPDQSVTGCNDEQQSKLLAARQAWLDDEWFYCGVVLSVSKAGVTLDNHASSLWGIECNYPDSDNAYLTEIANELLPEALEVAKAILEKLAA